MNPILPDSDNNNNDPMDNRDKDFDGQDSGADASVTFSGNASWHQTEQELMVENNDELDNANRGEAPMDHCGYKVCTQLFTLNS